MSTEVPLAWLQEEPPAEPHGGTKWGFPLARGRAGSTGDLSLHSSRGQVAAQFWPLATWPDGSLKWVGAAVGAGVVDPDLSVRVGQGGGATPSSPVRVTRSDDRLVVDNGLVELGFALPGEEREQRALVETIRRGDVVVARDLRLTSLVQHDVSDLGGGERLEYSSRLVEVSVEQEGPVRAVVRVNGVHRAHGSGHEWLPFVVRFALHEGSADVGVVHSLVFDGDAQRDFLAGLGVRADVPLRDAPHDRHVRIAGADGGLFSEAVRGLTGLRRDPGPEVRAAQIRGDRTPPVETWNEAVSGRLDLIPAWGDFTLVQPNSDGFSLRKRTREHHGWVGISDGTRSDGYVALSDSSGGLGLGVRHFWQSHPGQLDVRGAAEDQATVTAWLYSPEAPPMDLRFYHDGMGQDDFAYQLEGLEITYEDYEPGFGDPHGVARTHELTLFTYEATPTRASVAAQVERLQDPPLVQATPAYLASAGVFGDWAPVDRSTPARAEIEDSLDFLVDFYTRQVEQRRWYGFWNFGDVMHAYDFDRHTWRYDVGGYAWDNSELSPDLWLWYTYLRSGRRDVFRLAEAMTRHTSEVDVYHLGPWQGLGSRHNVQHWGCSAKQLRISSPAYRRFFHYLTADERVGDLLAELRHSDELFTRLDPTRKVRVDAATYRPQRNAVAIGLGTDWGALAATWLTDWERTGNEWSRDRLLGTMADIAALSRGFLTGEALYDLDTGRFDTSREQVAVSHLSAVFGLVEICSELISLVDVPGFEEAWVDYCRLYLATPEEQTAAVGQPLSGIHLEQAHSRLAAYAASRTGDQALAERAWQAFEGMGEWLVHRRDFQLHRIEPPAVLSPVDEAPTVSTNDASQYGLAAIQNLALVGDLLDD